MADLTAAKEAAEAVLAEAVAAAPAPAEEAEATEPADEAVAEAETAVQEAAAKLADREAKGPFYTEPVEESVVEDPEALTPLSKEAGCVLSEMWDSSEKQFFDGTKKAFRSCGRWAQTRRQHFVLRQDFVRYLARPTTAGTSSKLSWRILTREYRWTCGSRTPRRRNCIYERSSYMKN